MTRWIVPVILLAFPAAVAHARPATQPSTRPTAARPTVIVVVGAEGSPEYGAEFRAWAGRWSATAERGSANVIQIGLDSNDPEADRERLRSVLEAEVGAPGPTTAPATVPATGPASRPSTGPVATDPATRPATASPTSPLWLVLIGHGTFDGREAKFNVRGPDVSDQDLAAWLRPCRRPFAVIDCTSASAPFLNRLSGPGRVVVTATQSGREIQYSRFGDYLSAAVGDPAADLDKDGQTSLLEAFLAASHRTAEFYKQSGRLATEHALLDDNGDALGTPGDWFQGVRATRAAMDGSPRDGHRARQWHLVPSPAEQALPAETRARRDELELKVEALRDQKSRYAEADYYRRLEALLLELARMYEGPEHR